VSVPLGSSVLTDLDLPADPPTPDQLRRAHERAQAALGAIGCPPAERAWAVGGSATTLRRVVGADLTASALSHALDAVTQLPSPEAAARLDVHAQRARLLPAGLVLLATVASVLGCPLGVAGGGLREGVVLDLAARMG
jgi:exopolyphosphatase/guanosine-5'-triphosphate,3'-diphosphate pyrophosphatase